ncbi:Pycsar system effector family protein [Streptosporangium lutulentum]
MTQPTIPSTARPRRWPTRSSRRGPSPFAPSGRWRSSPTSPSRCAPSSPASMPRPPCCSAGRRRVRRGGRARHHRLSEPAAAAMVGLWGAAALLATAVVVLLVAVRPRIPRTGGTGFIAHARADNGLALLAQLNLAEADRLAEVAAEVQLLSQIAVAKYATLRVAVDLLIAALVVLAIVLPLAKG